jgi:hypothetical protein
MEEIHYNNFHVRQCKEREKEVHKSNKSSNQTPMMRAYIDQYPR